MFLYFYFLRFDGRKKCKLDNFQGDIYINSLG